MAKTRVGVIQSDCMGKQMLEKTKNEIERQPNQLIDEKSPYLLQHAYNPVEWFPWSENAFKKASEEKKPIFLSIGYSTCHWCHVMEHESFEDLEVAELMNDTFVSIKVDREERPDLDNIYMTVCQLLTGGGGWPLTIIMTPDKRPFFAATYIPKQTRFGRIGMLELIPRIKVVWETRQNEVVESAEKIMEALYSLEKSAPGEGLDESILHETYKGLSTRFDPEHGGFNTEPKFPTPHNISFLLRYWKRTREEEALRMVEKTLQEMRRGGIYDHIGFGFHRYSTDKEWLVPHFEKMLYDQALLALAYMEAFQVTGKEIYSHTAKEIFEYVLRDMTSPDGGFYSAEDADSEGVEGKFYVWTEHEIRDVLNSDDADLIIRVYQIQKQGNYRDESTGKKIGTNILHLKEDISEIAEQLNLSVSALGDRIESARERLFKAREKRIHPHKDDKILTDWNGLMIAALARGAQVFQEHEYQSATEKATELVKMAITRARLLVPLEGSSLKVDQVGLVIGGGLSGMTAALALANQGFNVHLAEKENRLGGTLHEIYHTFEHDNISQFAKAMISEVEKHSNIELHIGTEVVDVAGHIGKFKMTLAGNGSKSEITGGAIIVATGCDIYLPYDDPLYGYGRYENVITSLEFERLILAAGPTGGKVVRASDGKKPHSVAFIQCVGSRDINKYPYCSVQTTKA